MRRGTPDQFIEELENKIAKLKGKDVNSACHTDDEEVDTSVVEVDDDVDVIEADEEVEEFVPAEDDVETVEEVEEDAPPVDEEVHEKLIVDPEPEPEEDTADYLTGLYQSVEKELADLAQSIAWSSDEDNVYMDISFADGHVFTFTIPKADLAYDIENMGQDIEYICQAVTDTQGSGEENFVYDEYGEGDGFEVDNIPEEDASYNMEDYYDEEDRPAYL